MQWETNNIHRETCKHNSSQISLKLMVRLFVAAHQTDLVVNCAKEEFSSRITRTFIRL